MLDGPFILNEILQWCTKKKKKTLIFKVDFEKAFDSINGDFLDRVETRRSFIPLPLYPRTREPSFIFSKDRKRGMFKGSGGRSSKAAQKSGSLVLSGLSTNLGLEWRFNDTGFTWQEIVKSINGYVYFTPIKSIRSHFFNGHDLCSKKASWVKWNNALTDKNRGGLGVSSLFALNRGLMIKWVWKFLSQKDSLWTKVIVAIHGVGGKIHSEWTSTGKSCWLSILSEVRSLQRKGMYVFDYLTHKMGNGESTKFWLDHWHTRGIFKDIFPRLYALESSKDVTVSSKIGDTSLVCSFRRIPRGGIEQNQFDSLVELVRSVTIVPSADRWNWNLESTGIFSVASARRRIDEICLPNIGEETRWVKCVPIKINVLAWKIKTDALPTRFNISRRGIDIQDMSCPICDNAIESTDHLFFRCGLVRDIANKVLSWWNLDHANLNSYAEWKSWLVSIRMDSKLKKMFEGVWYSIWCVWSQCRYGVSNVLDMAYWGFLE
ncbi:RNA-directed DNA polymerase, eukaryota, reverse transcriptase zinc-binding domain protein [Tanacetum coccineum]